MENASLPSDVWNNVITSSSELENQTLHFIGTGGGIALKVFSTIIGVVGVLGNLFVIIIFALFIKITDKVLAIQFILYLLSPSYSYTVKSIPV